MRIVYMGTPDFAVASLKSIITAGHDVCAVFTQPDKPKGRNYTLTPPAVKVCALEYGIEVYQLVTLKDGKAYALLKDLRPDCIVVAAYGKILPKEIIDLPPYGCINVHGSLLPKYRGAAPIQWSILNGEKETGITAMYMDEGIDTGDMLMKTATPIDINENAEQLNDRLSLIGAQLIVKVLTALENKTAVRQKQDDSLSSYSPMLDKSLCSIDWDMSAQQVHNKVRGLNPWPVAVSKIHGKPVKIYQTELCNKSGEPGEVLSLDPLIVACKSGSVVLKELQLEGKKRMPAVDFLRGHKIESGEKFGL